MFLNQRLRSWARQSGKGIRRPERRRRATSSIFQAAEICEARQVLSANAVTAAVTEVPAEETNVANTDPMKTESRGIESYIASRLRYDGEGHFRIDGCWHSQAVNLIPIGDSGFSVRSDATDDEICQLSAKAVANIVNRDKQSFDSMPTDATDATSETQEPDSGPEGVDDGENPLESASTLSADGYFRDYDRNLESREEFDPSDTNAVTAGAQEEGLGLEVVDGGEEPSEFTPIASGESDVADEFDSDMEAVDLVFSHWMDLDDGSETKSPLVRSGAND